MKGWLHTPKYRDALLLCGIILLGGMLWALARGQTTQEETPAAASYTLSRTQEDELVSLLSALEGVGETQVMLVRADSRITGAVIVAEGAKDVAARLRILQAAEAALGIPGGAIQVFPMEEGG